MRFSGGSSDAVDSRRQERRTGVREIESEATDKRYWSQLHPALRDVQPKRVNCGRGLLSADSQVAVKSDGVKLRV